MSSPNNFPEILWGARQIGEAINLAPRQTFNLLEHGKLPAKKIGKKWCAFRAELVASLKSKPAA
jgi:hypothetical protein